MKFPGRKVAVVASATALLLTGLPSGAAAETEQKRVIDTACEAAKWIATDFAALTAQSSLELVVESTESIGTPDALVTADPGALLEEAATEGSILADETGQLVPVEEIPVPPTVTVGETPSRVDARPANAKSVHIGLGDVDQKSSVEFEGVTVVELEGSDDLAAAQTTDNGVRVMRIITSAESPVSSSYDLGLPEGTNVYPIDDGSLVFEGEGAEGLGIIEAPWAKDANGVPVPTHYEYRNGSLTQFVDHQRGKLRVSNPC